MNIIEAITSRHSVRAFLDKEIPRETLAVLFDTAKWAPSGVNTQPWQVHLIEGSVKKEITEKILKARANNTPPNPDYDYYPSEWIDVYKERRKACGLALYSSLAITPQDQEKRLAQWNRNYQFFDAPVAALFFIDSRLGKGSWLDMGMFLQNIMLVARNFELATCPQAALAEYPSLIRETLAVDRQYHLICGMAIGYPDMTAPVNQYRTTRESTDTFLHWHGRS